MKTTDIKDTLLQLVVELIKTIICVYDIVTLPLYAVYQKPWQRRRRAKSVRAKQVDPTDPYSPWVRTGTPPPLLSEGCQTIDQAFRKSVREYGRKRCFGYRKTLRVENEEQPDGKVMRKSIMSETYEWLTFAEVDVKLDLIMKGLLLNRVRPKDRVIIFMETRMEWMLSAQALYRVGATVATLYATLGDEGIIHGINEIEATHIITSSDLMPKLRKLQEKIPKVTHIICVELTTSPNKITSSNFRDGFRSDLNVISFDHLEKQGFEVASELTGVPTKEEDVALIMYTSGSTGIPKGVMATHKNVVSAVQSFNTIMIRTEAGYDDTYIGYLPLAHSLEFTAENVLIAMGIPIGFSTPFTLTENSMAIKAGSPGDANLVQPIAMAAVPLILDRIRKGVQEKVGKKGKLFKRIFDFAIGYKNYWNDKGFETPIVNFLVCRKIKALIGGKVRYLFAGGAPMSPETQAFARACLDVNLLQAYAATETAATCSIMDMDDNTLGRVGAPLFGVQVRLVNWEEGGYRATDQPNPRGEIVVGGDAVTLGYFKNETATDEVFKDEFGTRWFYSGDIGQIYPDGTLQVIDRKKDLLKLQSGEYVSLGKVEAELKTCVYVDNVCVFGESLENYVVALIIPNQSALLTLGKKLGRNGTTVEHLFDDPTVAEGVLQAIVEHGQKAGLHKSEIPMKIKLCREEWTPDSGLVTAALKIRRKQIQDFYQRDLHLLYKAGNKRKDGNANVN